MPFKSIVIEPRSHKVGSGPKEYISLNMVDTTNVRIPVSLGSVITMADETNMANHINIEIVELTSAMEFHMAIYYLNLLYN